jgi:hypothetical protein
MPKINPSTEKILRRNRSAEDIGEEMPTTSMLRSMRRSRQESERAS